MALKSLEDYLTGKPALVAPQPVTTTAYQWVLNYFNGQLALVLIQGTGGGGHGASLLLETGSYLLLETGDTLLLE